MKPTKRRQATIFPMGWPQAAVLLRRWPRLRHAPLRGSRPARERCPGEPSAAPRRRVPAYNLTGYPPAVRDGYIDGCESARHSEYARRDAKRFDADPQYAMGWNDGNSICAKK